MAEISLKVIALIRPIVELNVSFTQCRCKVELAPHAPEGHEFFLSFLTIFSVSSLSIKFISEALSRCYTYIIRPFTAM